MYYHRIRGLLLILTKSEKEIKKVHGKICSFAVNIKQALKIARKTLEFPRENIKLNIDFQKFLSDFPGILSFYTALENNAIIEQEFFRFGGGGGGQELSVFPLGPSITLVNKKCKLVLSKTSDIHKIPQRVKVHTILSSCCPYRQHVLQPDHLTQPFSLSS